MTKTHEENDPVETPVKTTIKYDRLPAHRQKQVRDAVDEEIYDSCEDKKHSKAVGALNNAMQVTMNRLREEPLTTAAVFVAVSYLTKLAREIVNAVRHDEDMPDDDHEEAVFHELLREYCEPDDPFNDALSDMRATDRAFKWFEQRKLDEKATEMFTSEKEPCVI